jgi:predicted DNA-binding protein
VKSMRRPIITDEAAEVRPIASSLPRLIYQRLDDAAELAGVTKAVLIRRAVCLYLEKIETQRIASPTT